MSFECGNWLPAVWSELTKAIRWESRRWLSKIVYREFGADFTLKFSVFLWSLNEVNHTNFLHFFLSLFSHFFQWVIFLFWFNKAWLIYGEIWIFCERKLWIFKRHLIVLRIWAEILFLAQSTSKTCSKHQIHRWKAFFLFHS